MDHTDRRNFLRAAFGLAAVAACGMTVASLATTAEAAPLPTLHQPTEEAGEELIETIAARRGRGRRRRGRIVIRRPRRRIFIRRRRRRCWRNRRGRLVCVVR